MDSSRADGGSTYRDAHSNGLLNFKALWSRLAGAPCIGCAALYVTFIFLARACVH